MLGLCYGLHVMAEAVGGRVEHRPEEGEIGTHEVELTPEGQQDVVFQGMSPCFEAKQGHHDVVTFVPEPFVRLAYSRSCPWQAFRHPVKPFYTPSSSIRSSPGRTSCIACAPTVGSMLLTPRRMQRST